jgi:hypothetical protein
VLVARMHEVGVGVGVGCLSVCVDLIHVYGCTADGGCGWDDRLTLQFDRSAIRNMYPS